MNWLTFTALLASVMALLLSIGALFVTVHFARRSRSTSAERLSVRLTELENLIDNCAAAIKSIRSRLNMQDMRARKASAVQPSIEDELPEKSAREELLRQTRAMLQSKK